MEHRAVLGSSSVSHRASDRSRLVTEPWHAARLACLSAALLYVAAFVSWRLLLLADVSVHFWALELSRAFIAWAYLPGMLLALMNVVVRSQSTWILLLVPVLAFAIEYGPIVLPGTSALTVVDDPDRIIRVMTWNMLYDSGARSGFIAEMEALEVDLIALQEVGFGLTQRIRQSSGPLAEFYIKEENFGRGGIALVSRYPILAVEPVGPWNPCNCFKAEIDWNGEQITVLVAHVRAPSFRLSPKIWERRSGHFVTSHQNDAFDAILEEIGQSEAPVLLLGDLNTTEGQPNYQRLRRILWNSHEEAGWGFGFTFPRRGVVPEAAGLPPFIRIDHIFFDDKWLALRSKVGSIGFSDHQYVLADLYFLPGLAKAR
jgi:vancomycin resistance protein VanJ